MLVVSPQAWVLRFPEVDKGDQHLKNCIRSQEILSRNQVFITKTQRDQKARREMVGREVWE